MVYRPPYLSRHEGRGTDLRRALDPIDPLTYLLLQGWCPRGRRREAESGHANWTHSSDGSKRPARPADLKKPSSGSITTASGSGWALVPDRALRRRRSPSLYSRGGCRGAWRKGNSPQTRSTQHVA